MKDLNQFPKKMNQVLKLSSDVSRDRLTIIAFGGGSVGDFAGFVASVLKRGVSLVQIPSTWLAAIDSAHGGKTALNLPPYKNQVGSFYPAEKVFLVESVLRSQPKRLGHEAVSEMAKIALIDSRKFWGELSSHRKVDLDRLLFKFLKPAIKAKWRVVSKDPYEEKGLRQVLNLGHTMGHALESKYGMSHGKCVGQGLLFSLEWSVQKKLMSEKKFAEIKNDLEELGIRKENQAKMTVKQLEALVVQDKKSVGKQKVNFVFLLAPGKTVVKAVLVSALSAQAKREGWIQ